ncbi:MAG TPA: AsmA-like C-terminal region-containing protein, partial [Candidatus Krumholzibacteria bacterium]|nr:AsmA-like C-terminal region-containing protein [Candidatus Krumholzibacteria bacterium]
AAPPQDGNLRATAKLSGTVGSAMIEALDVGIAALGATDPNVALTATGGPFDFTADSTQVFANARLKGTMNAGPLPLSGVTLVQKDPSKPVPVLGGEATARANFDGAMTAVAFDGEVDATNATYEVPAAMKKAAGIPAKATFRGTFRPQGTPHEGVEFESIDVTLHSLRAKGSGTLVPFKGQEAMDLTFEGSTAIAPWKDLLPAMAPMSPSGDAKVSVRVSGAPTPGAPPDIRGTATVTNFGAQIPNVPKPLSNGAATVAFTAKTARIPNATFAIGSSKFKVDADVSSMTPMRATYTVSSPEVARLDVQAPAPNAKPLPRAEVFRDVVVKGEATEKAPKLIENALTIASKSGIAANIDYTNAEAVVHATPEKSIIDRFSANAMGGTLSGSGIFEPKTAKFDLSTKVEKVNLAEYFRFKSPLLADVLVGRISADFDIAGEGKTWEVLQKTLTGSGGAVVVEGAFLNVNLAQQLFTSVQSMPMVPAGFADRIKNKNPKLFSANQTAFENLAGKVTIADGRINTNDLHLKSSDFSLVGGGWFSFGKEMDVNTTLTLSQKLTNDLVAEVPMAKYLLNSGGRFELPIKLSGAVAKPSVGVDANAIQAKLQQGLVQQGKDELNKKATDTVKGLLDGLTKKKAPAPPDTTKK